MNLRRWLTLTLPASARLAMLASLTLMATLGAAQVKDARIDVNGARLHISESGSGTPTVVFESGLGEDTTTWKDVQPKVAGFTHTVTYDRAGIGTSDPVPGIRTMQQMSADLHSLLHAARIEPPYVLVGHSLGGALVQVFAHAYPGEVAGLVLVDPEDGKLTERLHARMSAREWMDRQKALDEALPQMPAPIRAEMDACLKSAQDPEFLLPEVPVVVLTGTKKNPEFPGNPLEQDLKMELHKELLARTPNSKQVLAPNSRHYIQNDAPELVIDAIRGITRYSSVAAGAGPKKD